VAKRSSVINNLSAWNVVYPAIAIVIQYSSKSLLNQSELQCNDQRVTSWQVLGGKLGIVNHVKTRIRVIAERFFQGHVLIIRWRLNVEEAECVSHRSIR
jgi:hypothetical protein